MKPLMDGAPTAAMGADLLIECQYRLEAFCSPELLETRRASSASERKIRVAGELEWGTSLSDVTAIEISDIKCVVVRM